MARYNELFVDMKTSVTTYGSHNGIIVHSGVIQGVGANKYRDDFTTIHLDATKPYLPALEIRTPSRSCSANLSPLRICDTMNLLKSSRPASPTYSFGEYDSPPSGFIDKIDPFQLNVFQDSVEAVYPHRKRLEKSRKSCKESPDLIENYAGHQQDNKQHHPTKSNLHTSLSQKTKAKKVSMKSEEYEIKPEKSSVEKETALDGFCCVDEKSAESITSTYGESLRNEMIHQRQKLISLSDEMKRIPKNSFFDSSLSFPSICNASDHRKSTGSFAKTNANNRDVLLKLGNSMQENIEIYEPHSVLHRSEDGMNVNMDSVDRNCAKNLVSKPFMMKDNLLQHDSFPLNGVVPFDSSAAFKNFFYKIPAIQSRTKSPHYPLEISNKDVDMLRGREHIELLPSEEEFHLYQTRDAFGNVCIQW